MPNSEDLENEAGGIGAISCLTLGETLNGLPPCLSCTAQHVLLSLLVHSVALSSFPSILTSSYLSCDIVKSLKKKCCPFILESSIINWLVKLR